MLERLVLSGTPIETLDLFMPNDRAGSWQRTPRCRDRTNGGLTGCYPNLGLSLVNTA
jgi:hypothetical protein